MIDNHGNLVNVQESFVRVIGPRDKREVGAINCCSHSDNWTRGLSPFVLGPVTLWDGRVSQTVENAWQYSKVYREHLNPHRRPKDPEWYDWSQDGFDNERAVRYPMGKGRKPEGLWHMGRLIGYVPARKDVYWPLYRNAVRETAAFDLLRRKFDEAYMSGADHFTLWDFDGYERGNKTLRDVVNDPVFKMGHAFILAAMLIYGQFITPDQL